MHGKCSTKGSTLNNIFTILRGSYVNCKSISYVVFQVKRELLWTSWLFVPMAVVLPSDIIRFFPDIIRFFCDIIRHS